MAEAKWPRHGGTSLREGSRPFSAELTNLIFLRSASDFSVLCQAQPNMRHVAQRSLGARHSQTARQLQALLGVTPILAFPSKRGPPARDDGVASFDLIR